METPRETEAATVTVARDSVVDTDMIRQLLQADLAQRWRISPRTLERWRGNGAGPAWLQLNGRVLYRIEDVLAFERQRLRSGGR